MLSWLPFPSWIPGGLLGLAALAWWLVQSRLRDLPQLPEAAEQAATPPVCLCIPARNEVLEIGPALDSWLAQDYPELRILVVDDGSTDGTAEILAERSARHPERLRVIRNDSLPPGWLGRNHALHLAAQQPEAKASEWLLFVDAGARANPDLLRRAVAHLQDPYADILSLVAAVDTISIPERIFVPPALVRFLCLTSPKRVADPHSGRCCGTGGFTIVRRKAYEAIEGHAAAPLEAIGDTGLARRMKRAGFINRMAKGGPALQLRRYHGLREILLAMRHDGPAQGWMAAPFMILLVVAFSLSPLWLWLGGWPLAGLVLWIAWPALLGDAHQRFSAKPLDWIWILWPLAGLIAALGMAWSFADRLRGINHWRDRNVKVRVSLRTS